MKSMFKKIIFYDIEKTLLNNLTRVSFYLILILFTFQIIYKFSEWGTFITIIGGIIVFWYGYKKYERDKEIEMIDKLNLKEDINELIIDWKIKKRLNNKGYINDYLFNIIQDEYLLRIFNINGINKSNLYLFIQKAFNDKDLIPYFLDILLKIKNNIEQSIELGKIINTLLGNVQNNTEDKELNELLNYIKHSEQEIKKITTNNN